MTHALTIDVEDSHNLFSRHWLGIDSPPTDRVKRNTTRILELLEDNSTKATFFILGEVAAEFPELVRSIAGAGHEIGVHGYYHHQVFKLTPAEFNKQIHDAKAILEDISSKAVQGHRSPAFSITASTRWAWEILVKEGFKYDSSVFPFRGRRYGWPESPLDPYIIKTPCGSITEIPLSVVELGRRRIPTAGGGYLRMFPYVWNRWGINRVSQKRPVIVYIHPYEIETDPSPIDRKQLSCSQQLTLLRLKYTMGFRRSSVFTKLKRLLKEYEFSNLSDVFDIYDKTQKTFDVNNLPDNR